MTERKRGEGGEPPEQRKLSRRERRRMAALRRIAASPRGAESETQQYRLLIDRPLPKQGREAAGETPIFAEMASGASGDYAQRLQARMKEDAYYDEVRRAVGRGAPTVLMGTSTKSLERSLAKLTAAQRDESAPPPVVPEKLASSEAAQVTSIHVNARPWLWAALVALVGLLGWLIASKDWWLGLLIALVPVAVGATALFYVSMARDRHHFVRTMLHLSVQSFDIEVASFKGTKDREAEHQPK